MEFISYESPFQSNASNKKAIRSHITKRQHRLARELKRRARDSYAETRGDVVTTPVDNDQQSSLSTASKSERAKAEAANEGQHVVNRTTRPDLETGMTGWSRQQDNAMSLVSTGLTIPSQVANRRMFPSDSSFRALDVFIRHVNVPSNVKALGFDSSEVQVATQWWSSASVAEPAMHTGGLLVASMAFSRNLISPELVLHLQSVTIQAVIKAIASEKRRQDPALIIAVGCLAFYECLCGDRGLAQRVHRPAMRRLIQAGGGRDGIESLPLSWKKLSIMTDLVMEMEMGSEGDTSFLELERHQNAGILEAEWTEVFNTFLPEMYGYSSMAVDGLARGKDR